MAINAEDGAIIRGADIVSESRSTLTEHIDKLRGDIESIPKSSFDGLTATKFQALMAEWNEDVTRLVGALNNFEEDLRGTQQDFQATDEDRASTLNIATSNVNFTY